MAELVDALDSKSCGLRPCQFESDYPYQIKSWSNDFSFFLLRAFIFRQGCLYLFSNINRKQENMPGIFRSLFQREKNNIVNWFNIDERIRFVIVGLGNTLIRYLIFVVLGIVTSIDYYQIILLASWLLSSLTAFWAYKILVFATTGNHWREYGRSLLVWTLSYFINAGILELLVRGLRFNAYAAQAFAIAAITVINYLLFKHFAFKTQRKTFWEKVYGFFES